MGVVSCNELPRERQQSGKFGETYRYQRGFMVRVDDPGTPLPDITNATNISFLDEHPDDPSCKALEFTTKPESNSLLHYTVSVTYYAPEKSSSKDDGAPEPELLPGIPTLWTATSSVGSGPIRTDVNGNTLRNSAGSIIPDLEAEIACFKLSLKRPWPDLSWRPLAIQYTNATNSDGWMGAGPECWKCQGMSATPETSNEAGVTRSYWMTTWDFEYRAPWKKPGGATPHPGWRLGVADLGYMAKVDDSGHPDQSPSAKIGTIRDSKGNAVKEPRPLRDGAVVEPPFYGDVLVFQIYRSLPFTSVFGV